ncbi:hypothetical protein A2Z33_03695 [Candidatus Gottesmanbacteria bacterium RBG_16_52_11]|uniref:Uncharacterized protein n=1 Tax=Candidatus Gottesmanbacteria bacterium RBG_16_52_11 TaxID=1798374 RepID=A0A1F5YW80_9BACT|nr:MAG: hypothetical protein A2Z33_03695 [Candidatus Gottesmanbacteria bacterium RBG_16_52_11]
MLEGMEGFRPLSADDEDLRDARPDSTSRFSDITPPAPENGRKPGLKLFFLLSTVLLIAGVGIGWLAGQGSFSGAVITGLEPTPRTACPGPDCPDIRPTDMPTAYPLPTGKNDPTPMPSPTPADMVLRSSRCPSAVTVPAGRINVPYENAYARWQVKEVTERFGFLPRAEEVNGRQALYELRVEGQIYGDGEIVLIVACQDNANKWSQEDFLSYVLKTDFLVDPTMARTTLWGRDVAVLTYKTASDQPAHTNWFFATPTHLYSISKGNYINQYFDKELEAAFDSLTF